MKSSQDVMEGDLVTIGNGGEGVAVPATWLSQGYQSTISWIADIIGQFFYERGESVPCDQMEGLVLIDEIDLHLHPRWQAELIPLLKKVFPHLQFIVTTHSPMVLAKLKPEEIVRLQLDGGGNVVVAEGTPEPPVMLTGSQIYSRYFDLDRTEPGQLGAALHQYRLLVTTEDEELDDQDRRDMKDLRLRLVEAGIDPDAYS